MSAEATPGLSAFIQSHGAIIASDVSGERITHVSENIADVFDLSPDAMLGGQLEAFLPGELRHNMRNILSLRRFKDGLHFLGRYDLPKGRYDASVSSSVATGHIVFEFAPAIEAQQSADSFAAELRHLSEELRSAVSDGKLLEGLAGLLRVATGYDSVIIYRFDPDGGEIVAEARNSARRRLMGQRLRYFAAVGDGQDDDRRPVLRFIADACAQPTTLQMAEGVSQRLDLFYSHLRGATTAECAALIELDAKAAMTLPLVMNDGVWGAALLIHRSARTPTRYIRQLCDALASVVCDRMQILQLSVSSQPVVTTPKKPTSAGHHQGKSVLVLEDNRLIAADLKMILLDLGFEAVDLFPDEPSAMEFLTSNRVDLGILDIHLEGGETSYDVARRLAGNGTPFLFASGYGATANFPDELRDQPVALKPITRRKLSAKIEELFSGASSSPAAE